VHRINSESMRVLGALRALHTSVVMIVDGQVGYAVNAMDQAFHPATTRLWVPNGWLIAVCFRLHYSIRTFKYLQLHARLQAERKRGSSANLMRHYTQLPATKICEGSDGCVRFVRVCCTFVFSIYVQCLSSPPLPNSIPGRSPLLRPHARGRFLVFQIDATNFSC
jgi:hypothetical protein